MAEETSGGLEATNGVGLSSMDSTESRWVFQNDDESEIDEDEDEVEDGDSGHRTGGDSEDEDNSEQRLIRTGPRIDSFDVEALEVPGALRNDYEVLLQSALFSFSFANTTTATLMIIFNCVTP